MFRWSYLCGRVHMLPFHDWHADEDQAHDGDSALRKRCTHCNLSREIAYLLWVRSACCIRNYCHLS